MAHLDKFKKYLPKSSPDRFKYTYLALAFACLALMLCVAVFVIRRQSYNDFIIYIENNSQKIADAICYTEIEAININDHLEVPAGAFDYLDVKLRDTYDSLDILNVTILDAGRKVLYSNNKSMIGSTIADDALSKFFSTGRLLSTYRTGQTMVDLLGEKRDQIDIVTVYVPIMNVKGAIIGAFSISSNASELKSRYTSQLISSVTVFVLSILFLSSVSFLIILRETKELKHTYKLLESLASTDVLTGLYNRTFYESELERLATSRRYPVSVIIVDLDGLKETNDTFGHAAGDMMICKAADILRESVRVDDVVIRTGGDEFTVILPETNAVGLQVAEERINHCLSHANRMEDGYAVSFSVGSAIAETNEKLLGALKVADMKMYQNKAERKNAV